MTETFFSQEGVEEEASEFSSICDRVLQDLQTCKESYQLNGENNSDFAISSNKLRLWIGKCAPSIRQSIFDKLIKMKEAADHLAQISNKDTGAFVRLYQREINQAIQDARSIISTTIH